MVRQAMLLNKYSVALTVKSESHVWLDRPCFLISTLLL